MSRLSVHKRYAFLIVFLLPIFCLLLNSPARAKKDESAQSSRQRVVKSYYDNGRISKSATYLQGMLHGLYQEYHINGKLKSERMYKLGKLNGKFITYHPNGQVKFEADYEDDTLYGDVIAYDEKGKKISKRSFRSNMLVGLEMYDKDGNQIE